MSNIEVFKDNGQILFDTSLICYGLIKSGNMSLQQYWSRRHLRSAQLDPNDGANWTAVVVVAGNGTPAQGSRSDQLWGFTVNNALSPICFITGSGTLIGTSISGGAFTFLYSNASTDTKFYCFDLMSDNLAGTTFIKIYDTTSKITFNSLQPPLNVVGAYQSPAPPAAGAPDGNKYLTYNGGRVQKRQYMGGAPGGSLASQMDCIVDVSLSSGVEYAAFLPWSRAATITETQESTTGGTIQYSVVEGAYGRVGGISFMFGASAGTNEAVPSGVNYAPATYKNIPTDRYPTALYIQTANLPFPFN
ncbi:hypothetical protein [Pseudomonas sp. NPDC096950]|uniref:hypothetical protein n=1 Tax=Pseudomonas sp. NPDC096950 TaxID=3364485 RepID=UPI00383B0E68